MLEFTFVFAVSLIDNTGDYYGIMADIFDLKKKKALHVFIKM